LITLGRIESLDTPLYEFFPEWKQGLKQKITLRHVLSHTSGLQNVPDTRVEIYPSPDFVQLALAAELAHPPGTKFEYNNKAVNLLAGIVERVSGKKLDEFMRDEIFTPLGIREFDWMRDRAGNPHVMAGLTLYPLDLAKLGQLVLNRGSGTGTGSSLQAGSRRAFGPWLDAGARLALAAPARSRRERDRILGAGVLGAVPRDLSRQEARGRADDHAFRGL
jgi:CubicO group peptidase (beta-lactamase class C family)